MYLTANAGVTWSVTQKLLGSNGGEGQNFGYSVAVYGTTLVVGSTFNSAQGTRSGNDVLDNFVMILLLICWLCYELGCAYIFASYNGGSVWTEEQILLASDGGPLSGLGFSSAIYNNTVVIGASVHDGAGTDAGHCVCGPGMIFLLTRYCL